MTRIQTIVVVASALAAGGGSFLIGRGTGQTPSRPLGVASCPAELGPSCNECESIADCLGLSADEASAMAAADPDFGPQARTLRSSLDKERDALAGLLEGPATTDEAVMQQVERVITAHSALERRVAVHVLAIRKLLAPEQAKRLMGLAARSVRKCGKPCGRCESKGPRD